MLRRHYVLALMLAVIVSLALAPRALNSIRTSDKSQEKTVKLAGAHTITVLPWGPTQETIDNSRVSLLRNPAVLKRMGGARYRLVSFAFIDKGKINGNIAPPESYLAILFDYTHNRSYAATGRFDSSSVQVAPNVVQPEPSEEEFSAALEVLSKDPKIGPGIANGTLSVYHPMPPLIDGSLPVGRVDRTLAVGLQPTDGSSSGEIVGVDMISETLVRFPNNAPAASIATPTSCGVPSSGQGGTGQGSAGQYQLIISRGGVEVWNMIVVRPSASSAARGSGVEVLNVNYRGQRVLTRGHIPILNVQYDRSCGPYRDWCYSEDYFTANGTDVPGTNSSIRLCTSPPQTILESGTDTGNFRGVAIWDDREEVQLVTEMQAGWYRYLMEWNFTDDGIIKPRFGFGSTSSSCVCINRNHHVYWRFDFDVVTAAGNLVTENSPAGPSQINKEGMRPRLYGQAQTWTLTNTSYGASCTLIPGIHDSNYDKYGKGDVWVLVNHSNELDDGVNCTSGCPTSINIDPFVNGEPTLNADVVVWYGAHCNRFDASNPLKLIGDHVLGPDIVLKGY